MENRGRNKLIGRIPGCLIAYTAKLAFDKGYAGFVSLTPKTELIDHYIKAYGFLPQGIELAIDQKASQALILKYLSR